jgi:uncharacterized protein YndB with AHSA1/START domain
MKVNGSWRFVQRADDGGEHAFRGTYLEVSAPHKIVRTFEYEPMAGHILTETMLLESVSDTTTKLTATSKYENLADLESMVSAGMESGQRESFERLESLVQK